MGADKIPGRISRQALPRIKASPLAPLLFPSEAGLVLQTRKVTAPECVCYVLPPHLPDRPGAGQAVDKAKDRVEGGERERQACRERTER